MKLHGKFLRFNNEETKQKNRGNYFSIIIIIIIIISQLFALNKNMELYLPNYPPCEVSHVICMLIFFLNHLSSISSLAIDTEQLLVLFM